MILLIMYNIIIYNHDNTWTNFSSLEVADRGSETQLQVRRSIYFLVIHYHDFFIQFRCLSGGFISRVFACNPDNHGGI